ncbi:MAG: Fe-S cluster assembly protein SufD [Solirubrobacterales bacterium]
MGSPVAAEPEWLAGRREKARGLVETLPLPDRKVKGWEFTSLDGLELEGYSASPAGATIDGGDGEVTVMPLAEAIEQHTDLVEAHLGSLVAADDPFVARNEAEWTDGVFIHVPEGIVVDQPIRIGLDLDQAGAAVYWRTLVVLEEGASAEVWEDYRSSDDGTDALLNTVVEVSVGQAAKLHYVTSQDLSERAWLLSTQRATVDRDGLLDWAALGFGSGNGKVRMTTRLVGTGSEARVTGGYAGGNGQHLDYDTLQEHAAETTISDLAFRGILADQATAVWRGMIKVEEGAQKTDAFQECRNMLLSPDAHADAIPGLEILADDVACTHAAAIAQVDPTQMFYLESRGLDEETSRSLIVEGFLQSLLERLGEGPVRDEIAGKLEERLTEVL